jgi:hypothetical protein
MKFLGGWAVKIFFGVMTTLAYITFTDMRDNIKAVSTDIKAVSQEVKNVNERLIRVETKMENR